MSVNAALLPTDQAPTEPVAVSPDVIRSILVEHVHFSFDITMLTDDSDLYACGLTSHGSVTLMLALEEQFNIEFPEELLRRKTFESIASIYQAVASLVVRVGP